MSRGGNRRLGKSQEELDDIDRRISETVRKRWREKTPEEMEAFGETMRNVRKNKSLEEQEDWTRNSSLSLRKSWMNRTIEDREAFSKMVEDQWTNRSKEERKAISEKISKSVKALWDNTNIYGEERNRKIGESVREVWKNKSWEEIQAFRSSQAEHQKAAWNRLTQEERDAWVGRCIEGQKRKPSMPELLLGIYLEEKYPDKWTYNGDGKQGVVVGRKVPDFVRSDGTREVIEVFGAVGFRHYFGEEDIKIKHYENYGYKCTVIWEWDCYLPKELDKLFGMSDVK